MSPHLPREAQAGLEHIYKQQQQDAMASQSGERGPDRGGASAVGRGTGKGIHPKDGCGGAQVDPSREVSAKLDLWDTYTPCALGRPCHVYSLTVLGCPPVRGKGQQCWQQPPRHLTCPQVTFPNCRGFCLEQGQAVREEAPACSSMVDLSPLGHHRRQPALWHGS